MSVVHQGSAKRVLRGALLGCGHVSPFHLRAWEQIDQVEIVALANRSIETAQARAVEFGIRLDHVYSGYRDLLEREVLDFVDVATAPHVHAEQVQAAAAHGIHVLCQKPLAPSLEEARSMIAACNRAGVLLSVNENWRWRSWYRMVKSLLVKGTIGPVHYIRVARHNDGALPARCGALPQLYINQPYLLETEKLILYEWGVHLIDVVRFLLGEVTSVYARMEKVSPLGKGEDRVLLTLGLGRVTAVIDISWATVTKEPFSQLEHMTLEGELGTIELLPTQGEILRVSTRDSVQEFPALAVSPQEAYQASYTAAQQHFAECLLQDRLPETVASDNIRTLEALFAAYDAAERGQVVFFGEKRGS